MLDSSGIRVTFGAGPWPKRASDLGCYPGGFVDGDDRVRANSETLRHDALHDLSDPATLRAVCGALVAHLGNALYWHEVTRRCYPPPVPVAGNGSFRLGLWLRVEPNAADSDEQASPVFTGNGAFAEARALVAAWEWVAANLTHIENLKAAHDTLEATP
jgi:hypothetical protein